MSSKTICAFSEDQYEDAIIYEFKRTHKNYHLHFKPDRRLEKLIGFDLALFRDGLGEFVTSFLLNRVVSIDSKKIPQDCYVNAFIQCKIPRKNTQNDKSKSVKWKHWKGFYYEYRIDTEQNEVLAQFEEKLNRKGAVIYAAPCYTGWKEFQNVETNGIVLKTSNKILPSKLVGHHSFTYQNPKRGIAHSTASPTYCITDLSQRIKAMKDVGKMETFEEMISFLFGIIKEIDNSYEIIRFEPLALHNPLEKFQNAIIDSLKGQNQNDKIMDILRKYYTVVSWCRKYNLNWFVL